MESVPGMTSARDGIMNPEGAHGAHAIHCKYSIYMLVYIAVELHSGQCGFSHIIGRVRAYYTGVFHCFNFRIPIADNRSWECKLGMNGRWVVELYYTVSIIVVAPLIQSCNITYSRVSVLSAHTCTEYTTEYVRVTKLMLRTQQRVSTVVTHRYDTSTSL